MAVQGWADAVRDAREATGFDGEVIARTVAAVREAVSAGRHTEFDQELGALDGGGPFDAFLSHWWTQALADTAPDEVARERATNFADLAITLQVRSLSAPRRVDTGPA